VEWSGGLQKGGNTMNKKSGVYRITNQINQKVYIGSAVDLERREKQHFRGSHNFPLRRAMKKYGAENFQFDILVLCEPENLTFVEQDQIDYWKKVKGWKNMYNICPTAGSMLGVKHSEETKQKLSEAAKGKQLSEEHKQKISEALKGKKHPMFGRQHSAETKKLLSDALKEKRVGNKNPMYGRTGNKNPMYGRTGDKSPRYDSTIYLFQHKSGKTFQGTAYELRNKYELDPSHLSAVINKKLRSTGGWSVMR
jgi:group I intron endonuclease